MKIPVVILVEIPLRLDNPQAAVLADTHGQLLLQAQVGLVVEAAMGTTKPAETVVQTVQMAALQIGVAELGREQLPESLANLPVSSILAVVEEAGTAKAELVAVPMLEKARLQTQAEAEAEAIIPADPLQMAVQVVLVS